MREEQISLFSDNAEYDAFVEKFKPKKTTDDCYTPENVYRVVAEWVSNEYKVDAKCFVRPFWPEGDYEKETYPEGCVVVDNPPFSIMKKITTFYESKNIKFFLFCPGLTPPRGEKITIVAVGASVRYENGAIVNTSFATNLEPEVTLRTVPELYNAIEAENKKNERLAHKKISKYEYPNEVISTAIALKYSKCGIEFVVKRKDSMQIRCLDAQRERGKTIFGDGWLLSERAAAERAAAERAAAERAAAVRWKLSERELEIVRKLGKNGDSSGE